MSRADKDDNLEMDFAEFIQYMQEHERKLRLAFSDLDKNKDGRYSVKDKCYKHSSIR